MLQCVVVCCVFDLQVLQHTTAHYRFCNTPQHSTGSATHHSTVQHTTAQSLLVHQHASTRNTHQHATRINTQHAFDMQVPGARNQSSLLRPFLPSQVCNTLQHALQHTATRVATHCNMHCNTLQHALQHTCNALQHTAAYYSTLQRSAMHCNTATLQHTATHNFHAPCSPRSATSCNKRCNTLQQALQHTATHCNAL